MKLLNKTILYYFIVSFPLLIIAGLLSYYVIKSELKDATDETLLYEKTQAEKLIKNGGNSKSWFLSGDSLSVIKPTETKNQITIYSDTLIYNSLEEEYVKYRKLSSIYKNEIDTYEIIICKTTIEEEELLEGLLSSFALIIIFLLMAFFIANWLINKTLWKPFYTTLLALNHYDVKKHATQVFPKTKVQEFNELNNALDKMTHKIHTDYKQQKEFIENASHEMQTPLAIIKANTALLMQSPRLNEEDLNQLISIENTLKKSSALNKALLLLTKIDNHQFTETSSMMINDVFKKIIKQFSDLIELKNISINVNQTNHANVIMNATLADILITNLIQNAIRHNHQGGIINIDILEHYFIISNTGNALNINENELFTRFKKNDQSKDSLGLGLSIVKSIIDLHQFNIQYQYLHQLHSFKITF